MRNELRRVTWVGAQHGEGVGRLLEALAAAPIDMEFVEDPKVFPHRIGSSVPHAILMDAAVDNASATCLSVRMHACLAQVPVLWVRPELDDLVFAEVYGAGGDDVARTQDYDGIVRRLRGLPELSKDRGTSRGVVLVAEPDDQRRVVLARLLRNGGFDVSFSSDVSELTTHLRSDEPVLVVADLDLPGGGSLGALEAWRAEGGEAPWLMATPPKKLRETHQAVLATRGAWVWDSFAPPENVLYAANEALRGSYAEQRASQRLLYGTTVAFRLAGRGRDDHGFLYNVSGDGIFVRTLAPLGPGDEAWLEFKPPRTDRLVRLEANVVWSKAYGGFCEATVPPGFGARITGGSQMDLTRYRDGYRTLAEQLAGIRFSSHPPATVASD